jgi:hypothetical protein
MIKWKYKFSHQLNKRGLSELFVKSYYENKGWSVFNSSWEGYRLLSSNYFQLKTPLSETQLKIADYLQQAINPSEKLTQLFTIRRGLPDFLLIDKTDKNRLPRFIEVKSNNDGLSVDQIKMAEILTEMGFDVTIFFVMFTQSFKQPRVSKRLKNWMVIKHQRELLFKC